MILCISKIASYKVKFGIIFLLSVLCVAVNAHAEPLKLLIFGDSFAAGYGLSEADGFCPSLERALEDEGLDVEVINAGVSGDTSYSAIARMKETLAVPHDVLIVELGANDMLRALPVAKTQENLASVIRASQTPVYLLGMKALPNYGVAYQNAFDAIYPQLAADFNTGFYPFMMTAIFEDGIANSWRYFQRDLLHPNAVGVDKVTKDLAPQLANWLEKEVLVTN